MDVEPYSPSVEEEKEEQTVSEPEASSEFDDMSLVKSKGRSRGYYLLKRGVVLQPAPSLIDMQTSSPILSGVKRKNTMPTDTQRKRRKTSSVRRRRAPSKSRGRRRVASSTRGRKRAFPRN